MHLLLLRYRDYADLILVFMDPIGKALVSRTMNVVKELNKEHYYKMKYYMTKADTVGSQVSCCFVLFFVGGGACCFSLWLYSNGEPTPAVRAEIATHRRT